MTTDELPFAIRLVNAIVEKILTETKIEKIVSGINQILSLWKYIPDDLKKKTFYTFQKIFDKKLFDFSTRKEIPTLFFQNNFQNPQIKKIWESASKNDAAALYLGLMMKELINRAQHQQSEKIKESAFGRYHGRGLTITNMVTTDDIYFVGDEIGTIEDKQEIKRIFEDWVTNYNYISILVEPSQMATPIIVEEKILNATKSLKKDYIILNMSSNSLDTINQLIQLVEKMHAGKKIQYKNFDKDKIYESGFYLSFKGIIAFS